MNEKRNEPKEGELENWLMSMLKEHVNDHNRDQFRKMARMLAVTVYEMPNKRLSISGKYTVRPYPDQKKMKVLIVVAEPEKFQRELDKAMKVSANMEYGPKPKKMSKTVKGVRIDIQDG